MCLALPALVLEALPDSWARVRVGEVLQVVSTVLLDEVIAGDYVIVHVGFALAKVDQEQALHTLSLMDEIAKSKREE